MVAETVRERAQISAIIITLSARRKRIQIMAVLPII